MDGPHAEFAMSGTLVRAAEVRGGAGAELLELVRGRAPGRREAGGVPAGESGTGLVGALAEREQRSSGVVRAAHGLVREDRERAGTRRGPRAGGQRLVPQRGALVGGAGVGGSLGHGAVPGP